MYVSHGCEPPIVTARISFGPRRTECGAIKFSSHNAKKIHMVKRNHLKKLEGLVGGIRSGTASGLPGSMACQPNRLQCGHRPKTLLLPTAFKRMPYFPQCSVNPHFRQRIRQPGALFSQFAHSAEFSGPRPLPMFAANFSTC